MNQTITSPIQIVKRAAKRLKKHIPDKSYMQLLDIATYAFCGQSSFHSIQVKNEQPEINTRVSSNITDSLDVRNDELIKPLLKHGGWSYYPHMKGMVLEGTPWSPYALFLQNDFNSAQNFTATILHLQSKRKEQYPSDENFLEMDSAFEIDNLLILLDKISRHYSKLPIQELYRRNSYQVEWNEIIVEE
ncbi:hypothetical protein [Vibrio vulnificus]|uniref:hypothetical protein n=1 Tax=Vibrio vulnificus TaxID=672 RepID=UPI0019D4E515|nr:hypothetical protein [Vibrio vulnificus]EJT0555630.1 hypothetical protein [Vibrio vulnificus]MBN8133915.1 hypothetical protein [Vibrio vulnificus]MBN8138519.1 hypothetical protein [Vibrio vulnificus]MBN8161422.1 hypothetical protein [Vibrio vulnificus]